MIRLPIADAAREHDGLDVAVDDHGLGLGDAADDDVEDAWRQAGFDEDLAEEEGRERRRRRGTEDDGIPRRQGAEDVADGDEEGEVPGRDDERRTEGMEMEGSRLVEEQGRMVTGPPGAEEASLVVTVVVEGLEGAKNLDGQGFGVGRTLLHGDETARLRWPAGPGCSRPA